MNKNWNYGDAYLRYPCENGEIIFDNGSRAKVCDLTIEMPRFMMNADLLFIDPPWNQSNLSTFYTKADMICINTYKNFHTALFERIAQINPDICYVEIGKEFLGETIMDMKRLFKYVTFANSSYYHREMNICYVVRGSRRREKPKLDGMDEEDIIQWVCKNEDYQCIGDLCMGRGLVAINAYKNNKPFVGTELNHKRLSVMIEEIYKMGGRYKIRRTKDETN